MFAYKKLDAWNLAKELAINIYRVTKKFPSEEKFGITSQINRAAISIASNIAEGSGRRSMKEQAHFTEIAFGSLMELTCQLEIAKELGFIEDIKWDGIYDDIEILSNKLSALYNSQLKRVTKQL